MSAFLALSSCSSEDPIIDNNPMEDDQSMDDTISDNLPDAPDFSLVTTSGETLNKASFNGKTLVVFFFGFNCPPCKAVAPSVESQLYQEFKDNDKFAIIGADQWDGTDAGVDRFKEDTGVSFPLGVKGSAMARNYGTTYDRLVIINDKGKLLFKGNSVASNNLKEVIDIVKKEIN
jgi:peroxiredoxin